MRYLAKLIFTLGVLLIGGAGYLALDRASPGGIGTALADLAPQKAARAPLIAYLPEPGLGWTVGPWTAETGHLLNMARIPSAGQGIAHDPEDRADPGLGVVDLMAVNAPTGDTAVYRRASELVVIKIAPRAGGLAAAVAERIAADGMKEPFARYGRTQFHENVNVLGVQNGLKRSFTGVAGERIVISVTARARDGSIKALLGRIDFAGIEAAYGAGDADTGPIVNKLPQISTGPRFSDTSKADARVEAAINSGWAMRLLRLLGKSAEPEPAKPARVVINRGGREGCETNRGGCPMASMRR